MLSKIITNIKLLRTFINDQYNIKMYIILKTHILEKSDLFHCGVITIFGQAIAGTEDGEG
jgi:hypothetical protein